MKNVILSVVLAFIAFSTNAQYYIGGTLGFAIQSTNDEGASAVAIAPEFSYKLNNYWTIGTSVGISYNSATEVTTTNITPCGRYTFAQFGPINFFAEVALSYAVAFHNDNSEKGLGIGLRPGMFINVSDKIQLVGRTTLIQYSIIGDDFDIKQTSFTINPTLEFGIMFKI